jgi:hypothetical protein
MVWVLTRLQAACLSLKILRPFIQLNRNVLKRNLKLGRPVLLEPIEQLRPPFFGLSWPV